MAGTHTLVPGRTLSVGLPPIFSPPSARDGFGTKIESSCRAVRNRS
jgi:hypothetical protein